MNTTDTAKRAEVITFDQIRIGDQLRVTQKFGPKEVGLTLTREGVVASVAGFGAHTASGSALVWDPSPEEEVTIERIGSGARERVIEAMGQAFFRGRLGCYYRSDGQDATLRARQLARMGEAYDALPQAARDAIEGAK